jgi:predicted transcriptional regulator
MDTTETDLKADFVALTADVVSAYVGHNSVQQKDLPELIAAVHSSLARLGAPPAPPEPERQTPAIPIKRSITPDYLISLEDGRRYKSLKRHLAGRGLTPQQYREKWGLAIDYPMVAPNYAKRRSELAKAAGLGQQRRKTAPAETTNTSAKAAPEEAKTRRRGPGRRKAAAE